MTDRSGIHADEDLGDGLNVEILSEVDDSDVVVDDLAKALEDARDHLAIGARILLRVVVSKLGNARILVEDSGDVRNPCDVFRDRRVRDFELLFAGMEGDPNRDGLVVLVQDFSAKQRGHERGDALLTVDEDTLPFRRRAVF